MEERRDDNKAFKEEILKIRQNGKKPTLFLHACCGPCLTYPLSILALDFNVTVGFFNPNIYPESEYEKRLETLKAFLTSYCKDENLSVDLIVNEEDFLAYQESFKERIKDHEGGSHCLSCHSYRMGLAYEYASFHHYDYFTTVMTVSCKKPSKELNEIAFELAKKYPQTKYLYSDFKKENGQLKGIQLSKKYNLYRQDYCGCLPSFLERQKQKEEQAKRLNLDRNKVS